MKRLEEIKDEVAKELGHITWSNMIHLYGSVQTSIVDKIAKLYAREVAKASLEKAAENAATIFTNHEQTSSKVFKPSITHESNIVLL
ncbi:hypothetical protein CMV04_12285 [Elizabethkingia anophelis]|nr:hypothetical protein [Elizabethkingia anophelis]